MIYQESYSAIRKIIFDTSILFMFSVLLLSGSLMIFNGHTGGKPPDGIKYLLSGAFLVVGGLFMVACIYRLFGIRKIKNDWNLRLDFDSITLETPDSEEDEPFKYYVRNINRIAREEYYDDGVGYQWFVYLNNCGSELKKEFDIGPFSEEKITSKIKFVYDIDVLDIDAKGVTKEWDYSLGYRLKAAFGMFFSTLIFLSFLVPGSFYLFYEVKKLLE